MPHSAPSSTVPLMRYADPSRCPACRSLLPAQPVSCPTCGVSLRGPEVEEIFETCGRLDDLVARLVAASATGRTTAAPAAAQAAPTSPGLPTRPPSPAARTLSVPVVLLGLGALCLLVASVIFLAFAWAILGVGGRTAVLLLMTGVAGGSAAWLGRRGLTVGCEAFLVIALGLLTLDLAGAHSAGWLGDIDGATFVSLAALVLAGVGIGLAEVFEPLARRRPVVPQLTAALAALFVPTGGIDSTWRAGVLAAWVALALVGAWALDRATHRIAAVGFAASAVLSWLTLVALGIARGFDTSYADYLAFDGWPLLAAAALAALPLLHWRSGRPAVASAGVAGATLSLWAALPGLTSGHTSFGVATVLTLGVWVAVAAVVPRAWAGAVALAAVLPALGAALSVLFVTGDAFAAWSWAVDHQQPWDYALDDVQPWMAPWLIVAATALLTLLVLVPLWRAGRRDRALLVAAPAPVAVSAGIAAAAYGVPVLAGVVGFLAGAALLALGGRQTGDERVAVALGVLAPITGALALVPAWPADTLTLEAGLLLALLAASQHLRGRPAAVAALAGAVAVLSAAWAVAAAARLADVPERWEGASVLVLLGLLLLVRPRPEIEIAAALGATVTICASLLTVPDPVTPLAVNLTLAGAAVGASAVLHPSRRELGWPGGLLLAAATWVRLYDLGVTQPEAYTLPTAAALIGVGLWRLEREPSARSWPSLGAGLALATVPSLLWALVFPGPSLRALLLGLGCLALVLAGATLRWGAPLVVGAAVGAVLVLTVIGPYASLVPPWVLIGLGGALLVGLGVTWEARMREVRGGLAYLSHLR